MERKRKWNEIVFHFSSASFLKSYLWTIRWKFCWVGQIDSMTIKQPNETWCCSECGYSSKMLKASIISRQDFTVKYVSFIAQTGSHWRITWTENTEKREIIICSNIFLDFNFLINFKMSKVLSDAGQVWRCDKCLYKSKYKNILMELVKSKHVKSPGIINQFSLCE